MDVQLPAYIDVLSLLGIAVFAISGAIAGAERRLDLFGVVVLGIVVAIGGGTVRDLVLGDTPVFWVRDPLPVAIAAVAALTTVYLYGTITRWPNAMVLADAAGLAVFTVIGANTALSLDFHSWVAVLAGVLTGTFGGLIRDVLTARVPLILRSEIYATASLFGAVVYVLLAEISRDAVLVVVVPMIATFLLRLAAVYRNWSLPTNIRGIGR
jgi:uncharacterized membrane protein YeiH